MQRKVLRTSNSVDPMQQNSLGNIPLKLLPRLDREVRQDVTK